MTDKKKSSKSLSEHGIFFFRGLVEEDNCSDAINWILESNLNKNDFEYLTLIVNSEGGYIKDGFALIDVMKGSKIPIRTVGIGMIASMGLLIFLTGQKGTRALTPNTLILSHQWSGGNYGKAHELVAAQKENKIISDMILNHYKKHTGLSETKIKEYLLPAHDCWLKAQEAKKLGICDLIKNI